MAKRRILLVEDEQDIADLVVLHLGDLCDQIVVARDGHDGLRQATTQDWSLIILDLRLPGPDGLEICRAVRRDRSYQPILMLTSKSSELDRLGKILESELPEMRARLHKGLGVPAATS